MDTKGLVPAYWALLLFFTLFLVSCADTDTKDEIAPGADPQLNDTYQRILVLPVDMYLTKDYAKYDPNAAENCRSGLIERLNETRRFQVIPVDLAPFQATEGQTLVVKLEITTIHTVSEVGVTSLNRCNGHIYNQFEEDFSATVRRCVQCPNEDDPNHLCGTSRAVVKMTLWDGRTQQIIRNKEFSNQAHFCATVSCDSNYTFKTQTEIPMIYDEYDASLPEKMGAIIGNYIIAVTPQAMARLHQNR